MDVHGQVDWVAKKNLFYNVFVLCDNIMYCICAVVFGLQPYNPLERWDLNAGSAGPVTYLYRSLAGPRVLGCACLCRPMFVWLNVAGKWRGVHRVLIMK